MKVLKGRKAALAALCLVLAPVAGAQVYQWVDEKGRKHLSDKPPDTANAVTKQDTSRWELTPEQQQQGDRLRAEERAKVKRIEEAERRNMQVAQPATSGVDKARALTPRAETDDCRRKTAAFEQSRACWSQFILQRGGMKPGALETCGPAVGDPSQQCGISRNPAPP